MKKIITCTGYHGTGSSLVTDYLKEFDEICSLGEFEFRFIQDPNGIADLEDRLLRNNSRLNSDRAIYEYLRLVKILNSNYTNKFWKKSFYKKVFNNKFLEYSEQYINELVDLSWKGYWHDFEFRNFSFSSKGKNFLKRILEIIFQKKSILRRKKMYFSYPINSFHDKTKKYLNNLFEEISNKPILALDQLVPCCNIQRYLNYFDDIKVIVVDRDPRDIYILNKLIFKGGPVPCEDVDEFIKHFKLIRKHQEYEIEDKNKILRIKFEDTIYFYEETMKKIRNFLEIENLTNKKVKSFFDPQKSIYNTQVFELYPEYKKDIKKIEEELSNYCYNFPYKVIRDMEVKVY